MYHSNLITHDTTTDAFALYMLARCWDLNDDTRAFFAKTEPHFKTAVRLGRRLMLEYPELVRDVVKPQLYFTLEGTRPRVSYSSFVFIFLFCKKNHCTL